MRRMNGKLKFTVTFLFTLSLVLMLGLGSGCFLSPGDGDPQPGDDDDDDIAERATIEALLADFFPKYYNQQDSLKYEQMLDDAYQFELLDKDPDDTDPPEFWDKEEELAIAGHMFNGWETNQGATVQSINLDLNLKTTGEDNTNWPDKPANETWFLSIAAVDLKVFVLDQGADGFTNFIVFSDQEFVTRPDPQDNAQWVVYRQTDREAIAGGKN